MDASSTLDGFFCNVPVSGYPVLYNLAVGPDFLSVANNQQSVVGFMLTARAVKDSTTVCQELGIVSIDATLRQMK